MTGTVDPKQVRDDAGYPDERSCVTCRFYRSMVQVGEQGACMFNPPVVRIVMMADSPLDLKSVRQIPANTRPTVMANDVCSQHRFSDEPSDAELVAAELEDIGRWLRESIKTGV